MVFAHSLSRRPFHLHLALVPLYVTTSADLFLLAVFGARLSSGYLGIAFGNRSDTGDFLAIFWRPIALICIVFLIVYIAGLHGIRGVRKPRSPRLAGLAALGLIGSYGFLFHHFNLWPSEPTTSVLLDIAANETSAPLGAVFQTALAVRLKLANGDLVAKRAKFTFEASKRPSETEEVYVWVIGESSRPQNWSLFGYPRDTTPRIDATSGILRFPNMMTTAPETRLAVPSMMSLRPISEWSSIQAEKSIVAAFREAGFKTYWLSTQDVDGWSGVIPEMANEAAMVRYFADSFDGAMLDQFRKILQSDPPGHRKLFIVLHTKGSHFDYQRRYPPDFSKFSNTHASRRATLVNAYDNSVYYTDWFLAQVISALSEQGTPSALMYASDHGENLLDDQRQFLGHVRGTRYDLSAAAFIWLSAPLRSIRADVLPNIERNATKPLSLSNLSHSMLDLAGIETPFLDSSMSLLSDRFEQHPRFFMMGGAVIPEGPGGMPP
jgi:heptose-I-phosphate ethanolaminephosphotransferase